MSKTRLLLKLKTFLTDVLNAAGNTSQFITDTIIVHQVKTATLQMSLGTF